MVNADASIPSTIVPTITYCAVCAALLTPDSPKDGLKWEMMLKISATIMICTTAGMLCLSPDSSALPTML